ncbi:MAG: isochorismatase family protein [Mesorhizobium sp.]
MTGKPWEGVIPEEELLAYRKAGFGAPSGLGRKPALLIIDVQYRTVGTEPKPFFESIKEFPTSCGEVGWKAVGNIAKLLQLFRDRNWPVVYPYVAPKIEHDHGRLAEKIPALMTVGAKGYEFVPDVAPAPKDLLLPKRHPSAFFGTPLVSYLINMDVDTLIVTGCTTSGCVRSTVVDAFSFNFKLGVPHDAVYDRSATSHAVNLFDMSSKYADVSTTEELMASLSKLDARAA